MAPSELPMTWASIPRRNGSASRQRRLLSRGFSGLEGIPWYPAAARSYGSQLGDVQGLPADRVVLQPFVGAEPLSWRPGLHIRDLAGGRGWSAFSFSRLPRLVDRTCIWRTLSTRSRYGSSDGLSFVSASSALVRSSLRSPALDQRDPAPHPTGASSRRSRGAGRPPP